MFAMCADPKALEGLAWMLCYLTSGTHMLFYASFGTVLGLLAVTAPAALLLGFLGALAARSPVAPLRWIGRTYAAIVRGVPDVVFFLFVPIALDQGIEWLRSRVLCDPSVPVRQGNEFVVCAAAKMPLSTSPEWVHDLYGIALAVAAFAFVFGAFAANVLYGAMGAVPRAQLETAEAYGMTPRQIDRRILIPQMWTYALPGLSNLWMILIKATPLLFLLGVEDIVYWARELGGSKTTTYAYPHGDWRVWYFLALLVFYLGMTWISQRLIDRLAGRLSRGQATMAGEAMRKAGTTA
ncbi:ABC transporter permease subunit [Paracoccus chinensis]|uniref:Amino acid ABC transporter membrane protein 1, PAAT family (TC 3.A.1.3.-) n=1 Tax=Paracoccus chinensis TaxID=525640 RepID=A0A1G9HE90_9RHOB|nr:ABC transporter permease subunit [Paracoccus chinensis]SDL11156.1 amino acid ABC transporter membrane protein 1, PAAT family (TC 3.A.1.3.-) [Paracoccus chinensis]